MRTYSRKRTEYQVIEDVHELCRLCLEKSDEVVPIFPESSDVCATLPMRIMICVGLEMVREDCLPNMICKACYNELEQYYTFRKKCEVTYQKLKSHALAIKGRIMAKQNEENGKAQECQGTVLQNGEVDNQHLVLAYNDEKQLEIVDVVNLNGDDIKKLSNLANTTTNHIMVQSEENQIPDVPSNLEAIEITNEQEMSSLLSTLLLELGIMTQQDNRLKVVQNIRSLELEGGDGTTVTLELVEEDEICTKVETPDCQEQNLRAPFEFLNTESLAPDTDTANKLVQLKDSKDNKKKESRPICTLCGMRLSSRSSLARHSRVHTRERPYACPRCPRTFAQRTVLASHLLVHEETKPFACTACGKSYTRRPALAAHARTHARALALHRCPICDKLFLYASGLSRHLKMHAGRVYTCGACSRSFRDKSSLLRHLRSHARRAREPDAPSEPANDADLEARAQSTCFPALVTN